MKLIQKILVLIILFLVFSSHVQSIRTINQNSNQNLLNDARIEIIDGVKLLYLNGSYYEMGYQHGVLLKNETHQNMRAFLDYIEEISSFETMLEIWNETKEYVPDCYIKEMQGISDGADISFEIVAACYMTVLFMDIQCFTYSAWNNASSDGELYHFRSLDFPLHIKNPITGKYVQENSILIIKKPKEALKSLIPSIAGGVNFYQGINEKQISLGVQVCWSKDQTFSGMPVMFRIQNLLDNAENMQDAIEILTKNKTLGWNFIVSDAKQKVGYAIETTANCSYNGTWDNPVESNHPFWQIKEVVRRTNFFINPEIAKTQRNNYNPSGLLGFLRIFTGEPFFALWRKYKSMSEEIEKNWGKINLDSGMSLMRKVYTGRTDIFMYLFLRLNKQSILCDFQQWGVCPKTGDFVISFADANSFSHETKLHYFNLNDFFK
jgi:hypothetical protein